MSVIFSSLGTFACLFVLLSLKGADDRLTVYSPCNLNNSIYFISC